MSILTRTTVGLIQVDQFTRADSPTPGGDWTTLNGSAAIVSNALVCSGADLPGAYNGDQGDGLGSGFVQATLRYQDDAFGAYVGLIGSIDSGGFGFGLLVQNGTRKINSFVGGAFSGTLATDSGGVNSPDVDYIAQFYVALGGQEAWVETDGSPVVINAGAFGGGDIRPNLFRDNAADDANAATFDQFIWCIEPYVRVENVPSGYKAQILNSMAVVVAEANEGGGTCFIVANMAGGATEVVPVNGWASIVVKDSMDVVQATFDASGVYPGDIFEFGAPPSFHITTGSCPHGTVGVPYSKTLHATDGVEPYTWAIDSGSLPDGLSLDAGTGVISGTPTTEEVQGFTVLATDDAAATDDAGLSITIDAAEGGVARLTQLALEIVYDYSALKPYVVGDGQDWFTPPPTLS